MNQLQTSYLSIYPSNRSVPDLNYTSTVPVTVTVTSLLLSSLLLNVAVTTDSLEYSLAFSHNSYYTLLLFSYTSICAASGQTSVSAVLDRLQQLVHLFRGEPLGGCPWRRRRLGGPGGKWWRHNDTEGIDC